ncbi:MAG: imelysin family protein, partial [Bacteroidota bacterium]
NALDMGVASSIVEVENLSTQFFTELEALENGTGPIDLTDLRSSWLELSMGLRRMEVLDVDFELQMLRVYARNGGFDSEELEEKLLNNQSYIPYLGAMNAIEYLIFDEGNIDAARLLEEQESRRELLQSLGANVKTSIDAVKINWESKKEDIRDKFSRNPGFQLSRISTHMISFIVNSKRERLMYPMGILFGSELDAERLEAFRSENSLVFLQEGYSAWKKAFYGSYENSPNEYGYDDYLIFLEEEALLENLNLAIQSIDEKMADLSLLKEDVINQPAKVEALIDELQALEVLLKLDMMSIMQIILFQEQHEDD